MPTVRSILLALVAIFTAYYWAPSPMLPVEEGDAIVVTGAHTGIGKHASLTLAKEGFTVFCCIRKPEHGEELVESAQKFDIEASRIKPLIMDVTNPEQIEASVKTVQEFVGDRGLYGLFNNAGIGRDPSLEARSKSVEHYPMESFRKLFDVNYFGTLQVIKAFLPLIRKHQGRIINNTSIAGIFAGPFSSAYASTKHALEALSDSLRREVAPHGVKVSILEPGFIKTPIFNGFHVPKGEGVYVKAEQARSKAVFRMSFGAPSPQVTSAAVVHAMRAKTPRTRYLAGKFSLLTYILTKFPDAWIDRMFLSTQDVPDITEQELQQVLEEVNKDFEL